MKLTIAAGLAVAVCLASLAVRARALRAAAEASAQPAYAEEERLALAAIDGHLRSRLQRLSKR